MPDQAIEIHVRTVSESGRATQQALPEHLGISYAPQPKSVGSTEATQLTRSTARGTPVGDIAFADTALAKCVMSAVGGDSSYLAHQLTSLSCTNAGIEHLGGLEHFTGLQVLNLASNRIADLSALSKLTNVTSLNLSSNGPDISDHNKKFVGLDLAPLTGMVDLQFLHLDDNNIQSIVDITLLTQLDTLTIAAAEIGYVPDFSATGLRVADFSGNPITDVAGLAQVLTLESVDLSGSELGDLAPLITNAGESGSALANLDVRDGAALNCSQIADLDAVLGSGAFQFTPGQCVGLQPPYDLVSSANPSSLNQFVLSWQSNGAPSSAEYEINVVHGLSLPGPYITTSAQMFDFSTLPDAQLGSYAIQVRMCEPVSGGCSGWSAGIEQVVLADQSLPFQDALSYIQDSSLAVCLSEHESPKITEAGQLTDLTCRNREISDLTGLERFPGLSTLDLSDNQIVFLQPLSLLATLTDVTLAGNPLSSSQLSHLSAQADQYTNLNLSRTAIEDLSPLGALDSIGTLDVSITAVNDLSPIGQVTIPDLRAPLTQVSAIPALTGTVSLSVGNANVSDLSGLATMGADLQVLVLADNPIAWSAANANANALSQLVELREANLGNTGLTDTAFVSGWTKLARLSLESNPITAVTGLDQLASLQELDIDYTRLSDLTFASSLLDLHTLHAVNTTISNLDPLSGLPGLRYVNLSGGDLSTGDSLQPLASTISLEELILADTGVTSIAPLITLAQNSSSSLTSVNLLGEQNIPCPQVNDLWDLGVLTIPGGQFGECLAGQPELLKVVLESDMETYEVRWRAVDAPPGYLASGETRVDYEFGPTSGSVMVDFGNESTRLTQERSPGVHYRFRVAHCAAQGDCTDPTGWVYAEYPMQRPINTLGGLSGDGAATLEWGYPELPQSDQPDISFLVESIFPVVDPLTVPWAAGSATWSLVLSDATIYPGRAVTIRACLVGSNEQDCGPPAQVVLRETPGEPISDPLPEPAWATLEQRSSSEFGYRLTWEQSPDPRVEYYRVEELIVQDGNAEPLGKSHIVTHPQLDVSKYGSRNGGTELAYRVSTCFENDSSGEVCSAFASSNALSTDIQGIFVRKPHNVCYSSMTMWGAGGGNARLVTLRWTYPNSSPSGGDVKPPVKFISYVTGGPTSETHSSNVQHFHGNTRYNAAYDTWFYESKPVWIGPGTTLTLKSRAGSSFSSGDSIQPMDSGGYVDVGRRCDNYSVYDSALNRNTTVSPALMSPGHWVSAQQIEVDDDGVEETVYKGVQTGWQFFWSNERASLSEEPRDPANDPNDNPNDDSDYDGLFDLIAIWMTYEDRAEGDSEDWAPVWYYSKLAVDRSADEPTFASGLIYRPVKNGGDEDVGHLEVHFFEAPEGGDTTQSSREAWLNVEMYADSGTRTQDGGEMLAIQDVLTDELIIDPNAYFDNQNDHFRGIWVADGRDLYDEHDGSILNNANYLLTEWIVGDMLSWAVLGFDDSDSNNPMWLVSFRCANGDPSEECDGETFDQFQHQEKSNFNTVYPGHSPFGAITVEERENGHTPSNFVEAGWGTGVGRYYYGTSELEVPRDHRELRSCVDLHGPLSPTVPQYDYDFVLGDGECQHQSSAIEKMKKVANRHHIEVTTDDSETDSFCQMQSNSGIGVDSCQVKLDWSTDDDFGRYVGPSVVPMVTIGADAVPMDLDFICEDFDDEQLSYEGVSRTCNIVVPGTYRFRLVSRPILEFDGVLNADAWTWLDNHSAVIATSHLVHVNAPIPADPEPAPVGPGLDQGPAPDPGFATCDEATAECSPGEPSAEILETSSIGATRGQFRVTESGAAEYSIPVMTAKGVAGVEPEIALQYNSQQKDDGPLGRGWNVSGLSAITRCGQTPLRDNGESTGVTLTSEDRFCLDGQRLILIEGDYGSHGSIYRLEVDNLTKVSGFERSESDGIIGYFEVRRPDGSISTYGFNPDNGSDESAKVLAPEQGVPFAWPISRFSDSVGNYLHYEYSQPSHSSSSGDEWIEWLPLRIRYTGFENEAMTKEPFAEIWFEYEYSSPEARPSRYIQGNLFQSTRLLKGIISRSDDKVLRKYKFEYEPDPHAGSSMLQEIEECYVINDSNSTIEGNLNCLPATEFSWLQSGSHHALSDGAPPPFFNPEIYNFKGARAGDIDGDGREEVVYVRKGPSARAHFRVVRNETRQDEYALSFQREPEFASECNIEFGRIGGWALSDLNGDGRSGLVYLVKHCNADGQDPGIYHHGWDEGEEQLNTDGVLLASLPQGFDATNARLNVTDVDGDGRMDIVVTIVNEVSALESDILLYVNETTGDTVEFGTARPVVYSYTNLFDGIVPGECEYHYEFEVYDSGVVALDQSGKAALLARATRMTACGDQLPRLDQHRDSSGNFRMSRDTYLDVVTGGGLGDELTLDSFAHAWEFQGNPTDGYSLVPKLEIEEIADAGGEDFFVRPMDYNTDGYTDFLFAKKAEGGDSTNFQLLLNQGEAALYDEDPEIPKVEAYLSFSKDIKYRYAPLTLVLDSDGNGYPELLISVKFPDHRARDYRRHPWPWATRVGSGPEAVLVDSEPLGHDWITHDCEGQQNVPADIFGNGGVAIVGFVDPGDGDGGCAGYANREEFESVAFLDQELSRSTSRYLPDLAIKEFKDGFGAKTLVEYSSTGDVEVYLGGLNVLDDPEFNDDDVVVPFGAPFNVVKSVSSTSDEHGQSGESLGGAAPAMARVQYAYAGAKIQAGGRGFLGFAQVLSFDERSGILTESRYRQAFPYVGRPQGSMRWKVAESPWLTPGEAPVIPAWDEIKCEEDDSHQTGHPVLLGCSFTEWSTETSNLGGPIVFSESEREYHWAASSELGGEITGSQFTSLETTFKTIDEFGNVVTSEAETFSKAEQSSSALVYQQSVTNEYYEVTPDWHLGRLECSDVYTARRDGRNLDSSVLSEATTRTTRYAYKPATGLLRQETIDTATCYEASVPYKTTTYEHDEFGNIVGTVVEGEDGVDRHSAVIYEVDGEGSRGRYVHRTEVSLSGADGPWRQVEKIESRDRFGNPLRSIDGQGQLTVNRFDLLGRPYYSYSGTGGWKKSVNAVCQNGSESDVACAIGAEGVMCPAGSRFAQIESDAGHGRAYVCNDLLGREIRRGAQMLSEDSPGGFRWSYQDQRYDYASRPVWVTQPYLAGESVYWTETDYDQSGRVISIQAGGPPGESSSRVETRRYEGLVTRVNVSDGASFQERTETRNPMGDVITRTVAVGTVEEATTEYFYTAMGDLREIDTPVRNPSGTIIKATATLGYDEVGNRVSLSDPDKGDWIYSFNSQGDLVCQFDELGRGLINEYDPAGRLTKRFDVEGSAPPQDPEECRSWVQSDGTLVIPGVYSVRSATEWHYGDDQEPPGQSDGGSQIRFEPFGAVISEETQYFGTEPVIVEKEYTYDYQARVVSAVTGICFESCQAQSDFETFEERTTYDPVGRVFQQFDVSSSFEEESPYGPSGGSNVGGRGQQFAYQAGHLSAIREARNRSLGATYWRAEEMDARGNVSSAFYDNGMKLIDDFDPETGELRGRIQEHVTQHGYTVGQFVTLEWDDFGRLRSRSDLSLPAAQQHEWFEYDARNRLQQVYYSTSVDSPLPPPAQAPSEWGVSLTLEYDLSGNITSKSDVEGAYSYDDSPHGVTRAGDRSFEYDAAGNLGEDFIQSDASDAITDVRSYSYHAFQKVRSIARSESETPSVDTLIAEFYYGPDRNRVLQLTSVGGQISGITYYIGNVEVYVEETGETEFRRSIAGKVLVTVNKQNESSRARYLHRDHLGSIVAMSDESGYVVARMNFDAWGKRRSPEFVADTPNWVQWIDGAPPAWVAQFGQLNQYTPRGFTGHEHLDDLGIIHMNGRIYDPHLARFLQADPFVEDSGTLNRYTYSHNSPLVYYDPSGYFSFKDFARTIISVAISVYTGGAAASGQWALFGAGAESLNAVSTVMIGGALSGAVASGSWDGALWGAFSGAAFYGVGQLVSSASGASGNFAGSGLSGAQFASKTIGHGLAGGIVSDLRGGKFGHGFASSFVSAMSHPYIANGVRGNSYAKGTVAAIVGGTASRLSGGKFANGAATAAMAYAFNQAVSEHAAKLTRMGQRNRQIAELSKEEFEVLFDVNLMDQNELNMYAASLERELASNYLINDAGALADALRATIEAEYKSAGLVGFRRLKGAALVRVVSRTTGIDSRYVRGLTRADRVISEVSSIEPTLKAVAQGILNGDEEIREVFFND